MKTKKLAISVSTVVGIVVISYLSFDRLFDANSEQISTPLAADQSQNADGYLSDNSLSQKLPADSAIELEKPKLQAEEVERKVWPTPPIEPGHSRDTHFASDVNHGHESDVSNRKPRQGIPPGGAKSGPKDPG